MNSKNTLLKQLLLFGSVFTFGVFSNFAAASLESGVATFENFDTPPLYFKARVYYEVFAPNDLTSPAFSATNFTYVYTIDNLLVTPPVDQVNIPLGRLDIGAGPSATISAASSSGAGTAPTSIDTSDASKVTFNFASPAFITPGSSSNQLIIHSPNGPGDVSSVVAFGGSFDAQTIRGPVTNIAATALESGSFTFTTPAPFIFNATVNYDIYAPGDVASPAPSASDFTYVYTIVNNVITPPDGSFNVPVDRFDLGIGTSAIISSVVSQGTGITPTSIDASTPGNIQFTFSTGINPGLSSAQLIVHSPSAPGDTNSAVSFSSSNDSQLLRAPFTNIAAVAPETGSVTFTNPAPFIFNATVNYDIYAPGDAASPAPSATDYTYTYSIVNNIVTVPTGSLNIPVDRFDLGVGTSASISNAFSQGAGATPTTIDFTTSTSRVQFLFASGIAPGASSSQLIIHSPSAPGDASSNMALSAFGDSQLVRAPFVQPLLSEPVITDVTDRAFSLIWTTVQQGQPLIEVYSDAAATSPVTGTSLTFNEPVTGNPALSGIDRQTSKNSIAQSAKSLGIVKVSIAGLNPDTDYFVKFGVQADVTDEITLCPDAGSGFCPAPAGLLTIHTAKQPVRESSITELFVNDPLQVLNITAQPGELIIAGVETSRYPVSAFVGDGAPAPYALIDLNNLYSAANSQSLQLNGFNQQPQGNTGEGLIIRHYKGVNGSDTNVHVTGINQGNGALMLPLARDYGDCNSDGRIDGYDNLLLANVVAGTLVEQDYAPAAFHPVLCDLYKEKGINSVDTSVVINVEDKNRHESLLTGKLPVTSFPVSP